MCFDETKNNTIQIAVTVMLVPKTIVATTYAPLSSAKTPARIDSTPPARTSVTISTIAIHAAFAGVTRFFVR